MKTNGIISLLLADVDGTLVTRDKVITPRAREAVTKLREAGIAFAITSGRPPLGMKMVIEDLKIETPIAGFNGGIFVRPDFSVLARRLIPAETAARTIEVIRAHKLVAWLYTDTDWFIPDPNGPHVAREAWTVKFEAKVAEDFTPLLDCAVKIVGVSDDLEAVARCETDLRAEVKDAASAARSQPYYLDVTHPHATKGWVVEYLSTELKIPKEAIATIGDMPNDVLMFEKSGLSIAMGNASDDVKAKATVATKSNEEDGFAQAVEEEILNPHRQGVTTDAAR
jgi:Cof subfamily protein (haloacid dehalogenase superfamily)